MAKCTYCGADTQLFNNGIPVCVKCDSTKLLFSELRKPSNDHDDGGASEESGTNSKGSRSVSY